MDDDALNMRNWGYYEPSFKGHLGLQLMSSMAERDTKSFIPGRDPNLMVTPNAAFHPRDCVVSEAPIPMNYGRDSWISPREKFFNMLPATTPNYGILPETSAAHSLPILQPLPDSSTRDERVVGRVEEPPASKEGVQLKKRQGGAAPKMPKAKKTRKPKDNTNANVQRVKPAKKSMDIKINGCDMDISGIPIPVCSCTGTPQQCYRWGCGGWQSACCTTNVSMYPLPMSTKRRGARIAGRKMSQGAFKKVLEKLAAENYNFSNSIDLRTHWARHGTNKFVTISPAFEREREMEKEIYRDCQRNHACYLGGYAIDGCSEFIPSNTLESHCRACGCHRNYHRKVLLIDLEVQSPEKGHGNVKSFWSLREAKRIARLHHVLPVPISQEVQQNYDHHNFNQRKSKFSRGQREAMRAFADSLGWTMRNKGRQAEINRFCERIGVSRLIFKTWLNNNKKFYFNGTASTSGATSSSTKAI